MVGSAEEYGKHAVLLWGVFFGGVVGAWSVVVTYHALCLCVGGCMRLVVDRVQRCSNACIVWM